MTSYFPEESFFLFHRKYMFKCFPDSLHSFCISPLLGKTVGSNCWSNEVMANSRYEMPLPGNPGSCLQECQGVVVRFGGLLTVLTASVDIDILMVNWHGTVCHHLVIHSIFVFPYRVMPKTYSQNITCKISIKKKVFFVEEWLYRRIGFSKWKMWSHTIGSIN